MLERPKTALLTAFILVAAILPGLTRFKSDFSYRIWFRKGDIRLSRFDAFERKFGNDEASVVVVHSPSGIFDPDSARLLVDLTTDLWQVTEVIRVAGLANFNWVHAQGDDIMVESLLPDDAPLTQDLLDQRRGIALAHESLPGYLISADAKTSMIFTHLKPSFEGSPDYAAITNGIREVLKKYQGHSDHVFHITGAASISAAFDESTQADMKKIIPIVVAITLGLLLLIFRSLGGVLIPLLVIVLTISLTLSVAGWTGIPFTSITSIVPQILIAISIADAVHILATFFQARSLSMERPQAARLALEKNFIATVLTSLSTAIGFFSFWTSELLPLAQLGMLAGFGALAAWAITYLIVGPLMVLMPMRSRMSAKSVSQEQSGPWARYATDIIHRLRGTILALFACLTVGAFVYAMGNVVNSDPFKYFTEGYWLTVANQFVEDHVGGAMGPEILVSTGRHEGVKDPAFLRKVDAYQTWLEGLPYVTKTVSIVDILKQVHRSLHGDRQEFFRLPESKSAVAQELFLYTMSLPQGSDINDRVTTENDAMRITALWTLHDSATVLKTLPLLEAKAKELGLDIELTGKAILWESINPKVVRSFLVSISIALTLVSALLIAAFGSWRLGMLALIPNVVPLIYGGAILRMIGQPLDIGTVLVASVCLGIAVDDTIHFMSNFNRHISQDCSRREAVARVLTHTGPALIITTLVLVGSFGAFALATFVPNLNFGILVAMVLSVALVADLLFLPALLMTLPARISRLGPHGP